MHVEAALTKAPTAMLLAQEESGDLSGELDIVYICMNVFAMRKLNFPLGKMD